MPDGRVTDRIIEYHRVRAAAGCGLIIVEHAFVEPRGRHTATQIGIHSDAMLEGLGRLAAAIRLEGAVAATQITHAGAKGSSALLGRSPLGPSAVRCPGATNEDIPEAMTREQICEVVSAFGRAAMRARDAGFDAVELHAAHGFLLSEFLSPLTNRRDDEYGGSEENRCRLHLEVVAEVRRQLGQSFPLFIRLGVDDDMPGGVDLACAVRVAKRLVAAGVDLIDISGGLQGPRLRSSATAFFVPHAQAIKAAISVPLAVTGGIADPELADDIVRSGKADLVGIGKAMLEDAHWASKAIQRLGRVGNADA
jgi:2,4-dienoyl-CoA reductase-like NADH-dependent reductase (Old Yellow Enzyme family)